MTVTNILVDEEPVFPDTSVLLIPSSVKVYGR